MSNHRGGRLSRLFGYRLLIALLLCSNAAVAACALRESIPHASAAPAASTIACANIPPALSPVTLKHSGLTVVMSDPLYYDVGGGTAAEINAYMATCNAAQGEFAASATYIVNWRISYKTLAAGQCQVDHVAVGLHTRYIYPHWHNDGQATAGTAQSWNTFMQALAVHESGHVALDKQYAAQMLRALQALPTQSCQTIGQTADATAKGLVSALDQANTNYDAATGHGRTQGAVLE